MGFLIGGAVVVVLLVAVAIAMRRRPKNLPKLPPVEIGAPAGTWKLVYDPASKEIGFTHSFPKSERARFIVYFIEDMLFYYGWGAPKWDTSRELRPLLEAALDGRADWKVTERTSHDGKGNSFDGTMYERGVSRERVLGWGGQAEARPLGAAALVAEAVRGDDGPRAKKAIERMLAWYTEYGPTNPPSFDRSNAAWDDVAPLR